jgi:hypothetical protein
MTTKFLPLLLALTSSAALALTSAQASPSRSDAINQALANNEAVPVAQANPDSFGNPVSVGCDEAAVYKSLGQPSAGLADGSWLYRDFYQDGGSAKGTLLVRFEHGRVAKLELISPSEEQALGAEASYVANVKERVDPELI